MSFTTISKFSTDGRRLPNMKTLSLPARDYRDELHYYFSTAGRRLPNMKRLSLSARDLRDELHYSYR